MQPEATTNAGRLRGLDRDRHLAFLGVPFAGAPVRERRFLPPAPPDSWTGVRDATRPSNAAPQDPLVGPGFRATQPESEDCLYLNVYTPALDGGRRPVLFWIHGGGFSHGAATQPYYDGGPLVEHGDVVVVTTNYRLGALGYLYLGAHGGEEWGAAANAGQLDQVAALRWVRDNISEFGGDPDNVTVFGQSAGSFAVSALLAMPAAHGLFHRAIAQSGTANRLHSTASAPSVTQAFLDRVGIPDGDHDALVAAEVADIVGAQGTRMTIAPVVDGDAIPVPPLAAVRDGAASDIPLLIGTTRDEHKLYVAPRREPIDDTELVRQVAAQLPRRAADRAAEVVDVYRRSRQARGIACGNHDIADAVATASRFRIPAIRLAEAQQRHQANTFMYQFDWGSPARGGTLGACHGIDIPFVFGSIGRTGDDRMSGSGDDALALSAKVMGAWTAFARHGDPSSPGVGDWPAFDPVERNTMIFDRDCRVEAAPFDEERSIWESILARRAT
jgi:para-nitrobenzyl esterase